MVKRRKTGVEKALNFGTLPAAYPPVLDRTGVRKGGFSEPLGVAERVELRGSGEQGCRHIYKVLLSSVRMGKTDCYRQCPETASADLARL